MIYITIIHLFCCVRIVFRKGEGWCGKYVGAAQPKHRFRITLLSAILYFIFLVLLHTEEMIFLTFSYGFDINIPKYNI